MIRNDLGPWQKLGVTAFLAGGLVGDAPELPGEAYRDGLGRSYGPLISQPVLIFATSGADLSRALARAQDRQVLCSIYTHDLFATGNDADNRAAVARVPTEDLDLVGLAFHALRKDVDKITKDLDLHP